MSSQIGQDQWILEKVAGHGFFVDIGAYDGLTDSNTIELERNGWRGICVEPLPSAFDTLAKSRDCTCRRVAIGGVGGQIVRFRVSDMDSGIEEHLPDGHDDWPTIAVQTMSLNELLEQEKAPQWIDYISLDTEGSEIEILSTFDFDRWNVANWSVEHNDYRYGHDERSKELIRLFRSHGYDTAIVEQDIWCSRDKHR